jgi:hypothetical protein
MLFFKKQPFYKSNPLTSIPSYFQCFELKVVTLILNSYIKPKLKYKKKNKIVKGSYIAYKSNCVSMCMCVHACIYECIWCMGWVCVYLCVHEGDIFRHDDGFIKV